MKTNYPAGEGYSKFYVSLPQGQQAVGFRGRIVTHTKGQLDAFMDVPWIWNDLSGTDVPGSNYTMTTAQGVTATVYPNVKSDSIDDRYVDGLSLTVGCPISSDGPASCTGRQHVFTLATGTAVSGV